MAVLPGLLWRKFGRARQGYQWAPLLGFSGTGNVEGRTVIDGVRMTGRPTMIFTPA
jgi:hypothetical protein